MDAEEPFCFGVNSQQEVKREVKLLTIACRFGESKFCLIFASEVTSAAYLLVPQFLMINGLSPT